MSSDSPLTALEGPFVRFRDPREIWQTEPAFLCGEIVFCVLTLLSLSHAFRGNKRDRYLWLSTFVFGVFTEVISYVSPYIDSFWSSQPMVILFWGRMSLYVLGFYPMFNYTAAQVSYRLGTPRYLQPCVAGLCALLMDLPFDIMCLKTLWWTWHDTDPNVEDRFFGVPVTGFMFFILFASGITFLFNTFEACIVKKINEGSCRYFFVAIFTGLLAFPFGVVLFLPFYQVLHDLFQIHTMFCLGAVVVLYAVLLIRAGDDEWKTPKPDNVSGNIDYRGARAWYKDELCLMGVIHFLFFWGMVLFAVPENIRSYSLRQKVGDCNATSVVHSPLVGMERSKGSYLCAENFDEPYFEFCEGTPKEGQDWYTICGTPYSNYNEYLLLISLVCALGLTFFTTSIRRSKMLKMLKKKNKLPKSLKKRKKKKN